MAVGPKPKSGPSFEKDLKKFVWGQNQPHKAPRGVQGRPFVPGVELLETACLPASEGYRK